MASPARWGDEPEVVARAQAGDPDARRLLVERVLDLVYGFAHRRAEYLGDPDASDAIASLAVEGMLARSIDRFDPSLGYRWATFAGTSARRAMLGYGRGRHREVLAGDIGIDQGSIPDGPPDDAPTVRDADIVRAVERMLGTLAGRQLDAVRLRFGMDDGIFRTFAEVGEAMGISGGYAGKLVAEALRSIAESGEFEDPR